MSVDISPVSPASWRASGGRSEYPLITFIVEESTAMMPAKNTRSPARRNGAYRDSGFATFRFDAGEFATLRLRQKPRTSSATSGLQRHASHASYFNKHTARFLARGLRPHGRLRANVTAFANGSMEQPRTGIRCVEMFGAPHT